MKYTLNQVAQICGGELLGNPSIAKMSVESVFTDSRSLMADMEALFVAIRGRNHDGHAYVNKLYARGVRAFIIDRDIAIDRYPDAGFIRVNSSVAALQALAAEYRSRFKGVVVAVTGSNGKTVVKEWIADLTPPETRLFRSPKSYNSQIGVPLSILMIDGKESVAVIEAGISQNGEMELIEQIVKPDIGIVTMIGDAHQENFLSIDQKIGEKLELFKGAKTILYNSAYPEVESMLRVRYPDRQLVDAAKLEGEVSAHFSDRASVENASMAVTLCDVMGYDHQQTLSRLSTLHAVAMRLELKDGLNNSIIINDSYNSDINSLAIALDYLGNVAAGRKKSLILSDILQSGLSERELYSKVAQLVHLSSVDHLIGIGERIRLYSSMFELDSEFYPTTDAFLATVHRENIADRAILIKGSRSSQFERLSHALELKSHTTILEVDLDAMIHNLNLYRSAISPQTKTMAMIKASSYGHGSYEVAATLQHQGVDYLAVAFADEGVVLREGGITMPIVVLNADSDSFELMISNSLEPEIYNFSSLAAFVAALKRYGERNYPIHIKVDTGMHRLGFEPQDMERLVVELKKDRHFVRVSTLFSHLAASDDPSYDEFTRSQIVRFDSFSSAFAKAIGYSPIRHIANSAAIERMPQSQFDMVRIGIGMYGIGATFGTELHQVSTLKTRIVSVKELDSSQTVGYGRSGVLSKATRVATIPIGYADGLDSHLGRGMWSMMVGKRAAPTIGRICMDTCMIDVTGMEVAEGDMVTIFGGGEGNSIEDMARVLGTIPYEIMTSISMRVKRVYIKE